MGIPTWSDKLLQEVIRLILEAYFEPQFNTHSHGFRPARGCATALREIYHTWTGAVWFIEGDIKGCFDNIDHTVLLSTIAEKIHDNRFTRLLEGLLKAGYMENWDYNKTMSGTPQGGIVSPILANIYLDRLDQYVTGTLIPQNTRGIRRKKNPEYDKRYHRAYNLRRKGHSEEARILQQEYTRLPSMAPNDPDYRRLRYIRYADDFLLGFIGPRAEAEVIKSHLTTYLRDELKLNLSEEKTLITQGRREKAKFLGYEVSIGANDHKRTTRGIRAINGTVTFGVPREVIHQKCSRYMANGKAIHRKELTNNNILSIVEQYQAEYRGLVNYYRMAHNLASLGIVKWTMEQSLSKTLAHKLKISVQEVYNRYHADVLNDNGRTVKGLQVRLERPGKPPLVRYWGGTSLARKMGVHLPEIAVEYTVNERTELVQRLQAEACELCGSTDRPNVHHIRKLADLNKYGRKPPQWVRIMAGRRRKTLILCHTCHWDLHAGRLDHWIDENSGEPCDAKVSSTVRRGADGKVPA